MMKLGFTLAALASLGLLTGCAQDLKQPEPTYETAAESKFVTTNYEAAHQLIRQYRAISRGGPLIIATVVNIDNLEQSSTLGRVISEQFAGRFAQNGYEMIEMKFRNSVYMKRSEGELLLTREINEVARNHNAQAVIVGTYGTSNESVFVNMRIVEPGTNRILAVTDYVLPLNKEVRSMMSRTANR